MTIIDPPEFKKVFEKAERYATAALEIKKLEDAKNGIKKAKDAKGILAVDRNVKQQLIKLKTVLLEWEKALSPRFKQLVGSRNLFKELDRDIKINEKNLQKSAAEANKPPEKAKKVNVANDLRGIQTQVDKAAKLVKRIDDYLKLYKTAEPKIKSETIPPAELVKLQSDGKPIIVDRDALKKDLPAIEKSCDKLGETSLSPLDATKLKDLRAKVESYAKKLEGYSKLDEVLGDVKELHKKLYDDKAGWLSLVKSANDISAGMTKLIAENYKLIEAGAAQMKGLNSQWPETKNSKLKPEDFISRLPGLRDFSKHLKAASDLVAKKLAEVEASLKTLSSRHEKLLDSEIYKDQKKNDREIASAGETLDKNRKTQRAAYEALLKRIADYNKAENGIGSVASRRLLDYENFVAAAKLNKLNK